MPIVSVADELIGGLVAVEDAMRVIDQTGRKVRVRFVSPATFELLWVCGMDMDKIEVTDEVYETFFLTLTDRRYVFEVLSLVDRFYSARSHCPKLLTYLALTGTCTQAAVGLLPAMDNPTNPNLSLQEFNCLKICKGTKGLRLSQ